MKNIVIIGAGGFGRELLQWIKDINKVEMTWNILGFLDDNLHALDGYECDYSVIGLIHDREIVESEYYVMGIANPKTKESIARLYKAKGANFVSIIHPTALVADHVRVGEGLVMYPNSNINPNAAVGDFVTLLSSEIGHDAQVGNYSTISSYCDITGGVVLGERVFLGSHSTIIPKRKIGDDAYIAAGSTVVTNVKKGYHVFGNPAVKIN